MGVAVNQATGPMLVEQACNGGRGEIATPFDDHRLVAGRGPATWAGPVGARLAVGETRRPGRPGHRNPLACRPGQEGGLPGRAVGELAPLLVAGIIEAFGIAVNENDPLAFDLDEGRFVQQAGGAAPGVVVADQEIAVAAHQEDAPATGTQGDEGPGQGLGNPGRMVIADPVLEQVAEQEEGRAIVAGRSGLGQGVKLGEEAGRQVRAIIVEMEIRGEPGLAGPRDDDRRRASLSPGGRRWFSGQRHGRPS